MQLKLALIQNNDRANVRCNLTCFEAKGPCLGHHTLQEMIPKMIEAGTNIFRLNCSHRRGGDFERVYPLIRKYAKD